MKKGRDRKNAEEDGESKKDVKSGLKKEKLKPISKPKAKTAEENVKTCLTSYIWKKYIENLMKNIQNV